MSIITTGPHRMNMPNLHPLILRIEDNTDALQRNNAVLVDIFHELRELNNLLRKQSAATKTSSVTTKTTDRLPPGYTNSSGPG